MTGFALRVLALAAIYLLVLTSLAPGDILVGVALASGLVLALGTPRARPAGGAWSRWFVGLAGTIVTTARDMLLGTFRVARFCLGGQANPGFVEIPRGDRSRRAVALWGVLTGEAPDEYPVDVDDERHVLIVHLLDAATPDAVRERHAHARERWQRHVVP
jgi:multisubunit Na+/H+ antiporter MnhE subunit